MKKHFNSDFKPINNDDEWNRYLEDHFRNRTQKMYREFYDSTFTKKNLLELMKTGV